MEDKEMVPVQQFRNRREAWEWEIERTPSIEALGTRTCTRK
jgi:hypothetical protein